MKYNDFVNVNENALDDWKKITLDDIKEVFSDISFEDGGIVSVPFRKTDSIIVPNLEISIDILKYLKEKASGYRIGGYPEDIISVWKKLVDNDTVVKFAISQFYNKEYFQIVCFIFENKGKKPIVLEFKSSHTESPILCTKYYNDSTWIGRGRYDYEEFYSKYVK